MPGTEKLPIEAIGVLCGTMKSLKHEGPRLSPSELETWVRRHEPVWLVDEVKLAAACRSYVMSHDLEAGVSYEALISIIEEAAHRFAHGVAQPEHREKFLWVQRHNVPLSTLRSLSHARPPQLQRRLEIDELLMGGCVDPHVHQGAAIGFDECLRSAINAISDIGEMSGGPESSWLIDLDGEAICPLPLIAGLAILSRKGGSGAGSLRRDVHDATVGDLRAWASVRDQLIEARVSPEDPIPSDIIGFKQDVDASWPRSGMALFLQFEGILFRAFSQRGQGLDAFIASFNAVARLRRVSAIPRAEYVASVLSQQAENTPGIRHVDLRLGEDLIRWDETSPMADRLLPFVTAYGSWLSGHPNGPLASLPLGIIKRRPSTAGNWRFDTSGLWDGLWSLIEATSATPSVWTVLDGLDICGDELALSNWVLLPVLDAFSKRISQAGLEVPLRFHAGEEGYSPLNACRAINEALMVDRSGFSELRIGHGFAMFGDDSSLLPTQPSDELLDDFVFAVSLGESAFDRDTWVHLQRATWDLASYCYEKEFDWLAGRDVSALVRAYASRVATQTLSRISNIDPDGDWWRFSGLPSTAAVGSLDAIAALHLSVECGSEPLGERYRRKAIGQFEGLIRDVMPSVRAHVVRHLTDGAVTVEVCPSSNSAIGKFRGLSRHPVSEMVERSIPIVIGTDDPAVFRSWLGDEFDLLLSSGRLRIDDLDRARQRALEFCSGRNHEGDALALVDFLAIHS